MYSEGLICNLCAPLGNCWCGILLCIGLLPGACVSGIIFTEWQADFYSCFLLLAVLFVKLKSCQLVISV